MLREGVLNALRQGYIRSISAVAKLSESDFEVNIFIGYLVLIKIICSQNKMSVRGIHFTATNSRFHRIFVMYISSRYGLTEIKLSLSFQINPEDGKNYR